MERNEELEALILQQKREDSKWQTPEPGVVSYDRDLPGDGAAVERFVEWFNREDGPRADKTKKPKKRPKLTEAQRELMALALIRSKYQGTEDI